jgi:hypothetical protein
MRTLVVTPEPIGSDDLRGALGEDARDDDEVLLVAPALHDSPVAFWVSDADEAIARAQDVKHESVDRLRDEGVSAVGDTGDSDPLVAIEDALATFDAGRIVVFARHDGADSAYREEEWVQEARERFDVPLYCREIGRTERPDVPATQSALAPPDEEVTPPTAQPDPNSPHANPRARPIVPAVVAVLVAIAAAIVAFTAGSSAAVLAIALIAMVAALVAVVVFALRLVGGPQKQTPTPHADSVGPGERGDLIEN